MASKSESRGGMVSVRLGADERALVTDEALRRGESVSQFVREAVLDKLGVGRTSIPTFTATASTVYGIALEATDGQLLPKPVGGEPYVLLGEAANSLTG